ncbi:ankyrin repeat domain-containing protein 49 isoform X4 [Muntiacus reevesi]|uniref:ankyrin repeat domain-containing protein 49 isoform X4 n=1 Tax=Muntiacus reevesi TaxID=9886 RepID=UPI003307488C
MEKEKVNHEKPDPENSLDFSEHFNQLELLETHGHLIPTGTQSLWVGNSDEDEEQDEETEEWYQLQEKKMEKDPSKLLLWAAEKNRLTTVQRLLSERATHVNTQDEDKYTPLHRAAYSGHLDMVRELIAHGADVHAVTVDGWTPLHSALLHGLRASVPQSGIQPTLLTLEVHSLTNQWTARKSQQSDLILSLVFSDSSVHR